MERTNLPSPDFSVASLVGLFNKRRREKRPDDLRRQSSQLISPRTILKDDGEYWDDARARRRPSKLNIEIRPEPDPEPWASNSAAAQTKDAAWSPKVAPSTNFSSRSRGPTTFTDPKYLPSLPKSPHVLSEEGGPIQLFGNGDFVDPVVKALQLQDETQKYIDKVGDEADAESLALCRATAAWLATNEPGQRTWTDSNLDGDAPCAICNATRDDAVRSILDEQFGFCSSLALKYNDSEQYAWAFGQRYVVVEKQYWALRPDQLPPVVWASRLLRRHTRVPTPEIAAAWKEGHVAITVAERARGMPLADLWETYSETRRQSIGKQVAGFVKQWRRIESSKISGLDGEPYSWTENFLSGPAGGPVCFSDELQYHEHVRNELAAHGWDGDTIDLALKLMPTNRPFVFTHGNLTLNNIFIDQGRVSSIIGLGRAAYLPVWAEALALHFAHDPAERDWKEILFRYIGSPGIKSYWDVCQELWNPELENVVEAETADDPRREAVRMKLVGLVVEKEYRDSEATRRRRRKKAPHVAEVRAESELEAKVETIVEPKIDSMVEPKVESKAEPDIEAHIQPAITEIPDIVAPITKDATKTIKEEDQNLILAEATACSYEPEPSKGGEVQEKRKSHRPANIAIPSNAGVRAPAPAAKKPKPLSNIFRQMKPARRQLEMRGQPFTPRTVAARRRASVFQPAANTYAERIYPNGFNILEKKGDGVQCALRAIYDSFMAQCPERRGEMSLRDLGLEFKESTQASNEDKSRTYHFIEKLGKTLRVWGENRPNPIHIRLSCVLIDGREWVDTEPDNGELSPDVKIIFITTVNSDGALTYNVSNDFRGLMPSRRSLSVSSPRSPSAVVVQSDGTVVAAAGDQSRKPMCEIEAPDRDLGDQRADTKSEGSTENHEMGTNGQLAKRQQSHAPVSEVEALVSQIQDM